MTSSVSLRAVELKLVKEQTLVSVCACISYLVEKIFDNFPHSLVGYVLGLGLRCELSVVLAKGSALGYRGYW